ncbi:tetratricopeptide repeat protein [Ramlibacter henchirensis]|uniref:Tetratricopeptide repeat protein 38 n=1 Tax=Ramlibacter henchirensis TaxID=204072 RepID=A0A4Z0C554_9BURK|nr:tetratricopeptide repeat protein [Ramlibacter henchirensis]TFZ05580.1 tetratricopeptide repeat protein [Ramlibacter henchirensis]
MAYFNEDRASSVRSTMRQDPRGCPTSTVSAAAIEQMEQALESMLSYFGDALAALDRAQAADPGWAHAPMVKAGLLLTVGEYETTRQARVALATAARLAANAHEREKAHIIAAQAAADGNWDRACELWDAILVQWPRDVAALLFAHLFDFYRGDALNLKRRPQRVLPRWSPDSPFYGYVLGMAAFGLEESGHYCEAEDAGRAAVAMNPRDPWAIHAVTHVFEMQGRHRAGAEWLDSHVEDWAVDNGFSFHNWFHAALFQLEKMDTQAALEVYDAQLAPVADMALQRVDRTAILWRLKLLGVDVASRFAALRGTWSTDAPTAGFYAFNDLHALIACIGADGSGADALLAAMANAASGGSSNERMTRKVGLPLARAFRAYGAGRWSEATEGLLRVRDSAHLFGGSHAQRDIVTLTLLDAAVRAGERRLAAHILAERHPAKQHTPLTAFWHRRISGAKTQRLDYQ